MSICSYHIAGALDKDMLGVVGAYRLYQDQSRPDLRGDPDLSLIIEYILITK